MAFKAIFLFLQDMEKGKAKQASRFIDFPLLESESIVFKILFRNLTTSYSNDNDKWQMFIIRLQ